MANISLDELKFLASLPAPVAVVYMAAMIDKITPEVQMFCRESQKLGPEADPEGFTFIFGFVADWDSDSLVECAETALEIDINWRFDVWMGETPREQKHTAWDARQSIKRREAIKKIDLDKVLHECGPVTAALVEHIQDGNLTVADFESTDDTDEDNSLIRLIGGGNTDEPEGVLSEAITHLYFHYIPNGEM